VVRFKNTWKPLVLVRGSGFRVLGSGFKVQIISQSAWFSNLKSQISNLFLNTQYIVLNTYYFYLLPLNFILVMRSLPRVSRGSGWQQDRIIWTLLFKVSRLRGSGFKVPDSRFKSYLNSRFSHLKSHISNLCLNTQYLLLLPFAFKLYPCNEIPPPRLAGFGMTAG
jgi:hypothetical protein